MTDCTVCFVGASAICAIDGVAGRLSYRGYDIADLVAQATFPEVVFLLWHGELPARARLRRLEAALRRAGDLPEATLALLRHLPGLRPAGRADVGAHRGVGVSRRPRRRTTATCAAAPIAPGETLERRG
jgi:citrate synthase